jgi:hypothetical protein
MTALAEQTPSRGARHFMRAAGVLITLLAVVAGASPAAASWGGSGSAAATAPTGSLAAPSAPTIAATTGSTVALTWRQNANGLAPTGSYVTRLDGDAAFPACGSSPTTLIVGTACLDAGLTAGAYRYLVTSVYQSWTATSTISDEVTVAAAALVFTASPTGATAGERIAPPVAVRVQTADGRPIASATVWIALAMPAGTSEAKLSGTTFSTTDDAGVASFDDIFIDLPGADYTLIATSDGRAPATGSSFSVSAGLDLGIAEHYSVLAGVSVVSTGATTLSGNVGVAPGAVMTGLDPRAVGGTMHSNDRMAADAQSAAARVFDGLASRITDRAAPAVLGGRTLTAGGYHSTAGFRLSGVLTLDARGDPDAIFVLRTDATLNTAAASSVRLINGAQPSNVFWSVATTAELGADSLTVGTILARGAITFAANAALTGRALSLGTVTLYGNTINGGSAAAISESARSTDPAAAMTPAPHQGNTPSGEVVDTDGPAATESSRPSASASPTASIEPIPFSTATSSTRSS